MFAEIIQTQLTDIFRIGLLVGLVVTMDRTRAQTGVVLPLVAGVIFVAIIVPVTTRTLPGVPLWQDIAAGVVSNTVVLAFCMAGWALFRRMKG